MKLATAISILIFVSTLSSSPATLANPVCLSAASDSDGDGWGWENNESCVVVQAPCIDTDGDGWGWDGQNSCTADVVTECIDTDGDGYGWDGVDTCLVDIIADDPVIPTPVSPACDDTAPLNDTWGWDGTDSCRIAPVLAPQDTSQIAGFWDASDEDGKFYVLLDTNGFYTAYIGADVDNCFYLEDPNAMPMTNGVQFIPLGDDRYEIYSYELYNGFLDEERLQYEIRITANNELSLTYQDTFDDDLDGDTTELTVDILPAVNNVTVDELTICALTLAQGD